jgi:hypothetical protein
MHARANGASGAVGCRGGRGDDDGAAVRHFGAARERDAIGAVPYHGRHGVPHRHDEPVLPPPPAVRPTRRGASTNIVLPMVAPACGSGGVPGWRLERGGAVGKGRQRNGRKDIDVASSYQYANDVCTACHGTSRYSSTYHGMAMWTIHVYRWYVSSRF